MRQFRPRLTEDMVKALLEAIDTEASKLAWLYDDKKREAHKLAGTLIENDPIHFDKNPGYRKVCDAYQEAKRKCDLLESVEVQFQRLLNNGTQGRRRNVNFWRSRILSIQLRQAKEP